MKESNSPTTIKRRPGGRTENVRKKVVEAVLEMIRDGHMHFSYHELAERSGINKTTLYRRWPSQISLLQEALQEHNRIDEIKSRESWSATLEAGIREFAAHLAKSEEIALNLSFLTSPEIEESRMVFEHWLPIQTSFIRLIEDAQKRGELSSELSSNSIFAVMISPLAIFTLIERKPISEQRLQSLIEVLQTIALPRPANDKPPAASSGTAMEQMLEPFQR